MGADDAPKGGLGGLKALPPKKKGPGAAKKGGGPAGLWPAGSGLPARPQASGATAVAQGSSETSSSTTSSSLPDGSAQPQFHPLLGRPMRQMPGGRPMPTEAQVAGAVNLVRNHLRSGGGNVLALAHELRANLLGNGTADGQQAQQQLLHGMTHGGGASGSSIDHLPLSSSVPGKLAWSRSRWRPSRAWRSTPRCTTQGGAAPARAAATAAAATRASPWSRRPWATPPRRCACRASGPGRPWRSSGGTCGRRRTFLVGNWDVNVLELAAASMGLAVRWVDRRDAALSSLGLGRPSCRAVLANVRATGLWGRLTRGRHWLAVTRVGGHWYNLDSKLPGPQRLAPESPPPAAASAPPEQRGSPTQPMAAAAAGADAADAAARQATSAKGAAAGRGEQGDEGWQRGDEGRQRGDEGGSEDESEEARVRAVLRDMAQQQDAILLVLEDAEGGEEGGERQGAAGVDDGPGGSAEVTS